MKKNNQHYLTSEELKGLQKAELENLVEFDRICRKHNIIYSIDGGTLLGAVRHGGFIPWDDDADVIMVRSEYQKLKKVIDKELDKSRFYFQDMDVTPGYRWGYAKLRRKDSIFVRKNQEHMPYDQGIFMDIFVCDNVPDNYYFRCVINFISFVYRKILWSAVGVKTEVGIKKLIYKLLNNIPEKSVKQSYRCFSKLCNIIPSKWVKCLTFPACNKYYGYKREWYEDTVDIKFENVVLKGSRKAKEYLHFLYGDFMKLPPEDKRKVHPVTKFKLPDEKEV